jgi:membrane protease YdiL (CAAX protease family)
MQSTQIPAQSGRPRALNPPLEVASRRASTLRGFLCLAATWGLLSVSTTVLSSRIGSDWALVASLALALPPLALVAYRHDRPRWAWPDLEPCGFALVLGVFLLPLIYFHVGGMSELFDPLYRSEHPRQPQPLTTWLSLALLGPVLQEFLHRKLLLEALARQLGAVMALLLTIALYVSVPIEPWSLLGTATDAVLFGILMLTGKSLPLCIGLHVGFNLAAVWTGIRLWKAPLPLVELPASLTPLVAALIAAAYWFALRSTPNESPAACDPSPHPPIPDSTC